MPFTVITLKKVPQALRGDLTKWMQEITTGVYIWKFQHKGERKALEEGEGECRRWRGDFELFLQK